MKQYTKILIGLLIILICSFLLPYLFLLNFGKINSSSFTVASLLFSFLSLPLILVADLMYTKFYQEKNIKIDSKKEFEGKVLNKYSKTKKNEAPLFLLPMNMGFYLIAKALESDCVSYNLEILVKDKKQTFSVSKKMYDSIKEGETVKVFEITENQNINLSYFEMLMLNMYKNSVPDTGVRYSLI